MTDASPTGDGRMIPSPGIGTWQNDDPEQCAASVATALDVGYRHVDTAQAYGNEAAVGRGIENASVDRDELFLASKVWTSNLAGDEVDSTARESRDRLGVEAIDLLYVHWPAGAYDPEDTLPAFGRLRDEGVIRHVGVSNFTPDLLEEAVETCPAPILAHQFECHPLLPQPELRAACDRLDVVPVAYSPLARGRVMEVPELRTVADRHDATPAQVSLAWLDEKDVVTIPKATGRDHIEENHESRGLELSPEDVDTIDAIDRRVRTVDPDFGPWNA